MSGRSLSGARLRERHGRLYLDTSAAEAMLGAAALGDIGQHFPDTDPAYKGISSLTLLAHVRGLLAEAGYSIVNIDTVIICESPPNHQTINHQSDGGVMR